MKPSQVGEEGGGSTNDIATTCTRALVIAATCARTLMEYYMHVYTARQRVVNGMTKHGYCISNDVMSWRKN